MENYTIGENFTLPSLGKVYDKEVNPNIKLRSMTVEEEMKRLSPSERPYKNLCEIIDDCLVEKPGISTYDMCLGDYQFLLHKLRIVTYGGEYETILMCPYCGCSNERKVNLEDLEVNQYSDDLSKYLEFDLPKSKDHIKLRMQTPRILDEIAVRSKDKKKSPGSGESVFLLTIQFLIAEVNGERLGSYEKEKYVRKLHAMDANYILKVAEKINDKVGLDTGIEDTCGVCGADYKSSFRITAEFFGPSIDI